MSDEREVEVWADLRISSGSATLRLRTVDGRLRAEPSGIRAAVALWWRAREAQLGRLAGCFDLPVDVWLRGRRVAQVHGLPARIDRIRWSAVLASLLMPWKGADA